MINDFFKQTVDKGATTPAKVNLFEVQDDESSKLLDEDKADKFHHIVSILLYVSKRSRIDIDLVIYFYARGWLRVQKKIGIRYGEYYPPYPFLLFIFPFSFPFSSVFADG